MEANSVKMGNFSKLSVPLGQNLIVQRQRITPAENDLTNRRLGGDRGSGGFPPPRRAGNGPITGGKMPAEAEAAMDATLASCYDKKSTGVLPQHPGGTPRGSLARHTGSFAERIRVKTGCRGPFFGPGHHLQQERIERVAVLHPLDVRSGNQQRKRFAGWFGRVARSGGQSQQAAQLGRVPNGLGQNGLPIGGGRRWANSICGGADGDAHNQTIVTNPFLFRKRYRIPTVASYNTSDFRKGLKVQIDGDPYLMIECNFVKPGKGQALYKCKLRNLTRNTVLDRTYKSGDSLEAADIEEIDAQYLYRQGDTFVFMHNENYEQYELPKEIVDEAWKYLKEGMVCSALLFNNNPIGITPPNHVVLRVEYCEPGAKGNTATNVTKPVKLETGAEIHCPSFVEMGEMIRIDTRTGEYIERVKE